MYQYGHNIKITFTQSFSDVLLGPLKHLLPRQWSGKR